MDRQVKTYIHIANQGSRLAKYADLLLLGLQLHLGEPRPAEGSR